MRGTLILLPTLTLLNWGMTITASPIPYPMTSAVDRESPDSTLSATHRMPYDTRGDGEHSAEHIAIVERQIHNEDYGAGGDDAASPSSTQSASSAAPAASSTAGSSQPVARAVRGHRRRNTHAVPMYGTVSPAEGTDDAGSSKASRSIDAKMSGGWWHIRAIPEDQLNQPGDSIPPTPATSWRRQLTSGLPDADSSDPGDQLPSDGDDSQPMQKRQSTKVPGQPYVRANGNTDEVGAPGVPAGSAPVNGYAGSNNA
jgi:hypothetical protein